MDALNRREIEWLYLIGRLKTGVDPATVQSRLTVELQQWLNANPDVIPARDRWAIGKQHIHMTPAGGGVDRLRENYSAGLSLLMITSGLVLLIACANIANLLFARSASNRLQMAVRVALGAPRSRLIRQALTEDVVLSLLGGVAGLGVAYVAARAILLLAFRGSHYVPIHPGPSFPALGFAFLISLFAGVVCGVVPAWVGSRTDPGEAIHGTGRSTDERGPLARQSLVVLQVALSVVLLMGAGLLTKSLRKLETQRFGFVTQGRVVVHVKLPPAVSAPAGLYTLYQKLQQRLTQVPGVLSASLSSYSPLQGDNMSDLVFVAGHRSDEHNVVSFDRVSADYFETIGTRILRGRGIEQADTPGSNYVAVINQTLAAKLFPHEDPLGKHFGFDIPSHSEDYEIVGVVEDSKYFSAREPAIPTVFMPLLQENPSQAHGGVLSGSNYISDVELLVAGKPENLESEVRKTLADIDPNLMVMNVMSFGEQVARNFNQDRLLARLSGLFGLLALLLACVGLYGVTSYSVARRTNEIGIRMALGANRSSVLRLILHGTAAQVLAGLLIGVPAALAAGQVMASRLYDVKGYDPQILGVAVVILAVCALLAGFIPARRATKVDPMVALRCE
jgi:predicted permease